MADERLVTVYVAHGEPEAEVIRAALETENIFPELVGELGDSIRQFAEEGVGKIEIRVLGSDVERAQEVIRAQGKT